MTDDSRDNGDDPLLGLLTDIAEGVAALSDRIDTLEAKLDARGDDTSDALAAIAEIAVRIYYADSSKPSAPLSDDIINTGALAAMMNRWPVHAVIAYAKDDMEMLRNRTGKTTAEIDAALRHWRDNAPEQTHADKLRRMRAVRVLESEMDARIAAHEKQQEAERGGRVR